MSGIRKYKQDLISFLSAITDAKMMQDFLRDLLTPTEFEEIAKRLQIVQRLDNGESQRRIAKDLGTGIATVTRGSKTLKKPRSKFRTILRSLREDV
ncbi:MAG: transcriptional regulator [Candidatus Magasanikbacteria bacterium]|jgi:TrpR family transcriptional regulator, trp operon repressor|nr:transcriptional regulator [Candidatus Magasanikbacteria bacterium]MBT4220734.1 transcriptional regulator [Candidatus Magasanikbacteria bacterium]MBT4350079.1 transcriptional regulator [Candidatus Magasanikbacteria bacterium]MBT4541478.1 transcriptional regulator [Candidatus Magasanikbacteria bacterium]MBT6253006.1 transcriptional regulator [Candidatus Magasanikbacteria bacterium]